MTQYLRLQELTGRQVRDQDGKTIGRIEGVHAKWRGGECVIEEFELGTGALLARFGIAPAKGRRIPWQELDLSDPQRPRLRTRNDDQ